MGSKTRLSSYCTKRGNNTMIESRNVTQDKHETCAPYWMSSLMYYFTENVQNRVLCKVALTQQDLKTLEEAIEDLYYFEFVIGIYIVLNFVFWGFRM